MALAVAPVYGMVLLGLLFVCCLEVVWLSCLT